MIDFLNSFRDVFVLVLGWLLGTISPGILRAIQRSNRRVELLRGLRHECSELRFTLANALYGSKRSLRELDQPTLDLVKPILLSYGGTMDADLVAGSRKLFADHPDGWIIQW